MGILSNIAVSFPDTITIATTPTEASFHFCQTSTTVEDIWQAVVIGIIVISNLWIIGHYVCKSVSSVQHAKLKELEYRQHHELAKIDKEEKIRAATNEFNAKQTKEQREWLSEADRIKFAAQRYDLRLKEAEINKKIMEIEKNADSSNEHIKS